MSESDQSEAFKFSIDLLKEYSDAALRNASELLKEANLLFENEYFARSYFLAVSSIEETGKAAQTFAAQGRDISDSGVTAKLVNSTESHSEKITAAFAAWINAGTDKRESLMAAVDLMIDLKRGREPAMYSFVNRISGELFEPKDVVRTEAARDCIRVATNCLTHTQTQLAEQDPADFTAAQDKMYSMKPATVSKLLNSEDFWWYFIACLEKGQKDLAEAVIEYQTFYVAKNQSFVNSESKQNDT